jgi:hypothetical protein
MAALNIPALLDALCSSHGDKPVREAIRTWLGAAPAKEAKKSKPKAKKAAASDDDSSAAEDKPKRAQSDGQKAWNAFINLVCGPKESPTTGFATWLETHEGVKGNKRMVYAKEMKGDGDADYEAFKAEYKSTVSSGSSTGSADGAAAAGGGKPKPKAKAKAKKAAVELSESEEETPKPKKAAKKAPAAPKKAAKALPPLPASDDEEDSISRIELFDQEFFWDADTTELFEVTEDGQRGKVVGSYDGHSANFA